MLSIDPGSRESTSDRLPELFLYSYSSKLNPAAPAYQPLPTDREVSGFSCVEDAFFSTTNNSMTSASSRSCTVAYGYGIIFNHRLPPCGIVRNNTALQQQQEAVLRTTSYTSHAYAYPWRKVFLFRCFFMTHSAAIYTNRRSLADRLMVRDS